MPRCFLPQVQKPGTAEAAMSLYPWQEQAWQDLVRRSQGGLLLTGHEGLGKHDFALQLAQWLLCKEAKAKSGAPCGTATAVSSLPQVRMILLLCEPQEDSKQIKVDDVRKVNEQLVQTPQISHAQVVILRPAEVNINAANALLKTLEEPSGDSFLIPEAQRSGAVLPTIRSRCQRVHLQAPSTEQGVAWLSAQGLNATQAQHALTRCGNAPWRRSNGWPKAAWHKKQWLQELAELRRKTYGHRSGGGLGANWSRLFYAVFLFILLDAMKVRAKLPVQQHSLQGEVVRLLNGATVDG